MSDVAQAYLQTLATEREARIKADNARMEAEARRVYEKVIEKMPVELAEYYSFFSEYTNYPLKVSIPLHADFYVGYWSGGLKYKEFLHGNSFLFPLSDMINHAKNLYREPEPEPAPKLPPPAAIEIAKLACEAGSYDKAIAFALLEIAEQLREIDRSLCAN